MNNLNLLFVSEKCQNIAIPASAEVTITSDGFVSTAVYTCLSGYTLIGPDMRTCLLNGSWDGVTPVCGKLELIRIVLLNS